LQFNLELFSKRVMRDKKRSDVEIKVLVWRLLGFFGEIVLFLSFFWCSNSPINNLLSAKLSAISKIFKHLVQIP